MLILYCILNSSNVIIDHTIYDPVHGKYVVDDINAVEKRFLIYMMNRIQFNKLQEDNNIIAAHSSNAYIYVSLGEYL